ncbi:uncharacterized protein FTOL_03234 [Fusarium torulosum]|uniref:Uncharacterized protein n=1 Tax=Fusarium torulosum TaxID=33205 RepID=A0AAE8M3M1_9HYPO|nr:uncharacterized protein FTOL_03234 [Fusarium torulosum]
MSSQNNKQPTPKSILKGSFSNPPQISEPKPKLKVSFSSENNTVISIPAVNSDRPSMRLKDCPKRKLFTEGFSTVWVNMPLIESGAVVLEADTLGDGEVVAPGKELNYEELMALPDDQRAMVILTGPFEETAKRLRDHSENSK